jgi:hypothetical protein
VIGDAARCEIGNANDDEMNVKGHVFLDSVAPDKSAGRKP